LPVGKMTEGPNTSWPKTQPKQNTYCYLHPIIMMEYVCAGEVRFPFAYHSSFLITNLK
jgi:hypothetical protein